MPLQACPGAVLPGLTPLLLHTAPAPLQKRRWVLEGRRPEVPPPGELPGPDPAPPAELAQYCGLMRDCWAQEPQERPAFAAVVERLTALAGG